MKKLSKDAENRILTALESVADSVNDGSSPNDAIVKAASSHGIPAGHINLMVSAYNTGRTGKQRMAAENPFDKAAAFELADQQDIMSRLYPTNVKSAAQKRDEIIVDDEYSRAPAFAMRKQASQVAAREIDWKMVDKPAPYPGEEHTAIKRALHSVEFDKKRFEECRREVSRAKDLLADNFEKLSSYFRTPGGVSFDEVCNAAEIQYGGMGRAILNQVSRNVPQLSKEAKHDCSAIHPSSTHEQWMSEKKKKRQEKSAGITEVKPGQAPWVWIRDCVKLASDLHDSQRNLEALSQHITKAAEDQIRPFEPRRGNSVLGLSSPKSEKQSSVPGMFAFSHLVKNMGDGVKRQHDAEEDAIADYIEELDDPAHAEEMKRIQVRALIENLMANDPMISQESDVALTEAYNEIVQLTPRAADSPLLMRNLLRQHIANSEGGGGIMDPRDIGTNILGNEKALQDVQQNLAGQHTFAPGRDPDTKGLHTTRGATRSLIALGDKVGARGSNYIDLDKKNYQRAADAKVQKAEKQRQEAEDKLKSSPPLP